MPEPSGLMDGKLAADLSPLEDYSVCDLADEEVHFSREPISRSFALMSHPPQISVTGISTASSSSSAAASGSRTQTYESIGYQTLPYYSSTDSNWQSTGSSSGGGTGSGINASNGQSMTNDQARSYRLLHNIGSKLRRGSNYLIAPKLVGQYLLGITIQNWAVFFNTSRLMKAPANKQLLTRRVLSNLSYFQGNYLCVSLILVIYCILTSPLLLLALLGYTAALYLVTVRSALGKPTYVLGYRFNLQQQYSFITMISLPLLWVAGAPTALFWVIGASFFVVGLHALLYAIETLDLADGSNHQVGSSIAPDHASTLPPMNYLYSSSGNLTTITARQQYHNIDQHSSYAGNPSRANQATAYYNHNPHSAKHSYLPLEQPSASATSSRRSSYFYDWIPFTGRATTSSRKSSSLSGVVLESDESKRKPEVKIISQDYAGLGRIYEV